MGRTSSVNRKYQIGLENTSQKGDVKNNVEMRQFASG